MRRIFLVLAETVLLVAAGVLAAYIRLRHEAAWEIFNRNGLVKIVIVTAIIQLSFYLFDLYDLPGARNYRRVLLNLAGALGVATLLLAVFFYSVPALPIGGGVFSVDLSTPFAGVLNWRLGATWGAGHHPLCG